MREAIGSAQELPAGGGSIKKTGEKNRYSHAQRNALLCALVAGVCLLTIYPVAEMGIVDDWSYTKTALDFAQTGHLVYNGWNTAMLGWQIPWGALFIKLFGFSFTVVRLSTLPVAMASVFLFHQVLVRFKIAPRLAVFGALTLGLSPVVVPIAVRFMTDVPCLLVILLCIYMCQRAAAAASDRSALFWLCSAALVNVAGGTVRQIAWLGALVMVPSTTWLLRRRRGMMAAGIVVWAASVIAIFWLMHWFNQQPYVLTEAGFLSGPIHFAMFVHLPLLLLYGLLCLALILLPVLGIWLPAAGILSIRAWARVGICMLALSAVYVFLRVHPLHSVHGNLKSNIMPWLTMEVIPAEGIISNRPSAILGSSIVTLGIWIRVAISMIVVAAGLIFVEEAIARNWFLEALEERRTYWRELFWILGPFLFSYCLFLLPRAIYGFLFDRYLIPPMVIAIIVLLKLYQEEVGPRVPAVSWVILAIFAFYTVAATHDQFALDRARVFAADRILASGVPRTEIEGGLEYDGWTQIEHGGHMNEPFIRVPRGAYDPNVSPPPRLAPDCRFWYLPLTPAIRPKYFFAYEPMKCLAPSKYPAVGYPTWLPPFHRKVYIQQAPKNSN